MCWQLILEEFGPELNDVKGETNVVADALSCLNITTSPLQDQESKSIPDLHHSAELFGSNNEDITYPLSFETISQHQHKDQTLRCLASSDGLYHLKSFRGGDKPYMLICYNNKIVIPESLQISIVKWYHLQLCHPGVTRTEQTIRQHFWFKIKENWFTIFARNVQHVKNVKLPILNMVYFQKRKQKLNHGKNYV